VTHFAHKKDKSDNDDLATDNLCYFCNHVEPCFIHALSMLCSCFIHALSMLYSCFIHALSMLYSREHMTYALSTLASYIVSLTGVVWGEGKIFDQKQGDPFS